MSGLTAGQACYQKGVGGCTAKVNAPSPLFVGKILFQKKLFIERNSYNCLS